MTENSVPGLKVDQTNSNPAGSGSNAAGSPENESDDSLAEPRQTSVRVATIKLSDLRTRELTEQEKAEESRRLKEIRAGRHPDTGERLRPGDRKTLKPREVRELQMQRDIAFRRIDASYQRTIEALERERTINLAIYGTPFPSDFQQALHEARKNLAVDPLRDNPSLRDQLNTIQARQASMDGSSVHIPNGLRYDHVAQVGRERSLVDPLLDRNFGSRITGGVSSDLLRRATEMHDPLALRALQEMVESAAKARITEHWMFALPPPWSSTLANEAALGFTRDLGIMNLEAERMLSIYGSRIAEQTHFLTEYQSNLWLFRPNRLDARAFEGADLLARVALPNDLLPGFENYQSVRVERLRAYARARLRELRKDFEHEPNPVFAWEAFGIARSCGSKLPAWVFDHLDGAADNIRDIGEQEQAGQRLTEAELVGKAIGFSTGGRGQTGWFAHAKQVQRDRAIYVRMVEWLAEGKSSKLTCAYAEVAKEFGVDASTVRRAYRRFKDYAKDDDDIDA